MRLRSCFSAAQQAEKHLNRAKRIVYGNTHHFTNSYHPTEIDSVMKDMEVALSAIDSALELRPKWEQALELKARSLIYLRRFRSVVEMLHEYVPSLLLLGKTTPAEGSSASPSSTPAQETSPSSSPSTSSTPSSITSSPSSFCNSDNSSPELNSSPPPLQKAETLRSWCYSSSASPTSPMASHSPSPSSSSSSSSYSLNSFGKSVGTDSLLFAKKEEIAPSTPLGNVSPLLILPPATSIARLRQELSTRYPTTAETTKKKKRKQKQQKKLDRKMQWRFLVLGQACFHLGMMEDALVLLQSAKKTAAADSRRQSKSMREDRFTTEVREHRTLTLNAIAIKASLCTSGPDSKVSSSSRSDSIKAAERDCLLLNDMLSDIKLLLSRRSAAMAALETELYSESIRHFSKIIDGRRGLMFGAPRAFLADCFLNRSIAYQALHKAIDAIADCNKALTLNPHCIKALSLRSSIYESVCCFSESLLDLQQLKMIYEAFYRSRTLASQSSALAIASSPFFTAPELSSINARISSVRHKLSRPGSEASMDCCAILDLQNTSRSSNKAGNSFSMEDVERAYVLISLRHRPDKATVFLERSLGNGSLEENDPRDLETVKEEARACAVRSSRLIHRAYTKLLSAITEDAKLRRNGNRNGNRNGVDERSMKEENSGFARRSQRKKIYQEKIRKHWTSGILKRQCQEIHGESQRSDLIGR